MSQIRRGAPVAFAPGVAPFLSTANWLSLCARAHHILGDEVSDGQDFGCSFRLAYGEQEYVRAIYGVDAFQALMLALKTVSVHLKHDDWLPRDRMYWLEPGNGTGFPNPDIE